MRLALWQRIVVYSSVVVVAVSGLLWFVLHDFSDDEISPTIHTLLVVHGIASFATLIAFGSLLPVHLVSGWMRRRNLITGMAMMVVLGSLSVTGLLLYYGSEESHLWARWVHIVIGLLLFGALPLHVVLGRASRAATAERRRRYSGFGTPATVSPGRGAGDPVPTST